ncbi:MAG: DUF6134 family protein [Candidatus Binatia bacterium]
MSRIAATIATALVLALWSPSVASAQDRELRFQVLLDGSPIGSQVFRISEEGARTTVSIEATMDVRILFITAYSYRHRNVETWNGDCLSSIDATTDDNGDAFRVKGAVAGDSFKVERTSGKEMLPACVVSYSYWAPDRLRAGRLLNSQTGKYEQLELRELGEASVSYRGQEVRARHIALVGEARYIELWYELGSQEWIALESVTEGGRRLRYVRG